MFKVIDECKGKSRISNRRGRPFESEIQTFPVCFFSKYFSHGEIPELELIAHEKEDVEQTDRFHHERIRQFVDDALESFCTIR